jgi:ubiquinol-cytochrome c reductase cytochrome c1 subunit
VSRAMLTALGLAAALAFSVALPAAAQDQPAAAPAPAGEAAPAPAEAAPAPTEAAPAPAAAEPAATEPAATEPAAAPAAEAAAEGHEEGGMMHFPLQKPEMLPWSFSGFFGKYDTAQLQRGFMVFANVCANCHSLKYIAFRNLAEEGGPHFPEEGVKALAAGYQVQDGPNTEGDMFERPAVLADRFPSPFPNDQAAAFANGGAAPPDLSLIAKARAVARGPFWTVIDFFTQYQEAGPNYVHALLTGYGQTPPPGVVVPEGTHYNPFFLNGVSLAMPPPLEDGQTPYPDGTPTTVDQYAKDVSAFLMWAAEPHLDARKRTGFQVMIFLIVFAALMYLTKKRIWAKVH